MHIDVPSLPHIHCQIDFDWNFFPFLEFMASCMTTFYGFHAAHVNEEPPQESSLNLTLTQHFCDENLTSRKVHPHFEIEPLQAWYYCISLNSRTLVILLQVDLASSDEPKTICEGFYKIEVTSIFAWSSIPNIGHYCWLHGLIHLSPPIVRWIT